MVITGPARGPQKTGGNGSRQISAEDQESIAIEIERLTKIFHTAPAALSVRRFGRRLRGSDRRTEPEPVLNNIDIRVRAGEFLVLLGASGSGKTTLLRLIAGLERPTHGFIRIGNDVVYDSEANIDRLKRPVSMIFQSYALWPHMTAFNHVAFPLHCAHVKRSEIAGRVAEILDKVAIGHLADRRPGQMSGGQQQRLAFARALVIGQEVVLMDEPLSNVDAQVRENLRLELIKMQRTLGFTAIYVTHDQAEAMELADRIAVISEGRVAQIGVPSEVYNHPVDLSVARSLGQTNEVPFTVEEYQPDSRQVIGRGEVGRLIAMLASPADADAPTRGEQLVAFGRPHHFTVSADPSAGSDRRDSEAGALVNQWPAKIEAARFHGTATEYVVRAGDIRMRCRSASGGPDLGEGDGVRISIHRDELRAARSV